MIYNIEDKLLFIIKNKYNSIESGLLYGKAGLALYYAHLSSIDKSYYGIYKKIIDDILSNIDEHTPIEFSRGLLGIAITIDFISKFYNNRTTDNILDDIDAVIYSKLDIDDDRNFVSLDLAAEALLYYSLHIKYGVKNKTKKEIFTMKAISLLEYINRKKTNVFFQEKIPSQIFTSEFFFLYSLASLYEQGIYRTRIIHICDELIYELAASLPMLQFNCLIRTFLVSKIISIISPLTDKWKYVQNVLINSISVEQLFNIELKDKQIHFTDGLTGAFLLIEQINILCKKTIINISWDYYYTKIINSSIKQHFEKENLPIYDMGINGFWGVNYCLKTKCNIINNK